MVSCWWRRRRDDVTFLLSRWSDNRKCAIIWDAVTGHCYRFALRNTLLSCPSQECVSRHTTSLGKEQLLLIQFHHVRVCCVSVVGLWCRLLCCGGVWCLLLCLLSHLTVWTLSCFMLRNRKQSEWNFMTSEVPQWFLDSFILLSTVTLYNEICCNVLRPNK